MAITTEMIKKLREATGAGILDCRKALENADGNYEKAVDFLREKGAEAISVSEIDYVFSQDNPLFEKLKSGL